MLKNFKKGFGLTCGVFVAVSLISIIDETVKVVFKANKTESDEEPKGTIKNDESY